MTPHRPVTPRGAQHLSWEVPHMQPHLQHSQPESGGRHGHDQYHQSWHRVDWPADTCMPQPSLQGKQVLPARTNHMGSSASGSSRACQLETLVECIRSSRSPPHGTTATPRPATHARWSDWFPDHGTDHDATPMWQRQRHRSSLHIHLQHVLQKQQLTWWARCCIPGVAL
jgi:hypothetical protein